MTTDSVASFFVGIFAGITGLMGILSLTNNTPTIIQRNIHQEAVNLGYGRWAVNTNSDGYAPRTSFQWITNNIPSK